MKSAFIMLLAIVLGASFGAAWIFLNLYMVPGGVPTKVALFVVVPIIDLAIIKHFVRTSPKFDIAWVLLFTVAAVLAFILSGIYIGLQGVR